MLNKQYNKLEEQSSNNYRDNLKRVIKLEVYSKQHDNDIIHLKNERVELRKIVAENSIDFQDAKMRIDNINKKIDDQVHQIRNQYDSDIRKIQDELEKLKTPFRQSLEARQREAEALMYELKHVQKESRDIFTEFEKSKDKLLDVIEVLKNENIHVGSLQNTVSMINLNTKILMSSENPSETIISSSVRNVISPISQARAATAKTNFTKMSMAKLPILASKKGFMTARDISRNYPKGMSESDFKSHDGTTIKETAEDEAIG